MNRNFAVKILLILAIVLQSFNAVSALLYAHQVDAQHLETVHDHASDTKSVIEDQVTDAGDDDHNINDCHHCGHCSGSHFSCQRHDREPSQDAVHRLGERLTTLTLH